MENFFKNKKLNFEKLRQYGFSKDNKFSKKILNGEFEIKIEISKDNSIKIETIECETQEPYTLHLLDNAEGTFVGKIREEYENFLTDVAENCFDTEIFKSPTTHLVMKYITEKYGDLPEYLWEKFPENAIFRRQDNKKWYAAILTVQKDRLGFDSNEIIEIIDLRAAKEDVPTLIKQNNIYPGWHMNKKSWITIILDGSMPMKNLTEFIDKSYTLVK